MPLIVLTLGYIVRCCLEHHMISVIKYELDQKIESIENLKATSDLLILLNSLHSSLGEEFPIKQSYRLYPYGCLQMTIDNEQIVLKRLSQYVKYPEEMFGILPSEIDDSLKQIVNVFSEFINHIKKMLAHKISFSEQ